jgi:adenylyl-sulfate kinase
MARIARPQREALNGHRAGLVYLTGLSGAGKSTLATLLERRLHGLGLRSYVLDGDELRSGLCSDLGFSDADRVENMRRVTETARMMVDAGLMVITALISPFRAERDAARARFAPGEFMEVFVDAPLAVCEMRDPKGLYQRARRGEIRNFTGIDSCYEPPLDAEFRVDAVRWTPHQATLALLVRMAQLGFIQGRRASRCRSMASSPSACTPVQTSASPAPSGPTAGRRLAHR